MSEIMDDISYLSQEIGPRPAGTEEEQQAALYIADQMQKRTGFTANIEDFSAAIQPGIVEAICFGVPAVCALLAIIFSGFVLPAFLISLACAILYAFELMDRPLLSHVFERGVSQNVVARYVPGAAGNARNRKVVLVANYDSNKVQSELNGALFSAYPILLKAATIALVALPVIWFIRILAGAGVAALFNLLAAIALVLALVPVAVFFMHKVATYNEAANNNASGVATLLEVARLISEGSLSEEEIAQQEAARVHSVEEAYAAGVVPEGAVLEYAVEENQSEEQRLASAKAAVAALTGQPLREYQVEQIEFTPLAERDDIDTYVDGMDYGEYAYPEDGQDLAETATEVAPENAAAQPIETTADAEQVAAENTFTENVSSGAVEEAGAANTPVEETAPAAPAPVSLAVEPEPVVPSNPNEPSWYTTGRAKAVKPAGTDNVPVRRSRYADALEAALKTSKQHVDQAARMLDEGTIERISQMQRNIEGRTTASGLPYDAPLQDILSDHVETLQPEPELELEAEPEPKAEPEAGLGPEPTPQPEPEPEPEPTPQPELEEQGPEDQATTEQVQEAEEQPAQQPLDQRTTAMAPIDVASLMDDVEKTQVIPPVAAQGEQPEQPVRDFSQIEAVSQRRYRDISLPSFDQSETVVQDGPSRYSNPLMSESIPRINPEAPEEASVPVAEPALQPVPEPSVEEKRAALRNVIPSLSGEFAPIAVPVNETGEAEIENNEVSKTGSFATAGADIAFDPVGDELVASLPPEDRYVEDADDSSFDENTTETGAFAGPDYVEMPESRISRFFNRFRKKEPEETSASEWLNVSEDFNPTEVGAARGGWESFRAEEDEYAQDFEDYEYVDVDEEDSRSWHGGAFSQLRARIAGEQAEEVNEDLLESGEDEAYANSLEDLSTTQRSATVGTPIVDITEDARIAEETSRIYNFRNPDVNTEVWFAALGSEYAGNGGMKAFLAEHADELRGAIVINLEALGAGELCFIEEEGFVLTKKPSSRLKRFLHRASEVTGLNIGTASINWRESAASLAMKRGIQAMTIAGMDGAKPAYIGQGDDVLENIDEHTVVENAQFVLEVIKNI